MKRFFALAALVLGLAACQTEPEGLDVNVGGAVDTVITVNIPENETRANNSGIGVFENGVLDGDATMRYIFQVYYDGETNVASRQVKYTDGTSVSFPVRLVPGRDYQFVVWADVVKAENAGDNHYITTDLEHITLSSNPSTWVAMDETRDAFTATYEAKQFNGAQTINIDLYRPFAKLRVVTTDYDVLNNMPGGAVVPDHAVVTYYTKHRSAFNAYTSKAEAADLSGVEHENYTIATYTRENNTKRTIFSDYFFAENDVVKFEMTVYDTNGDEIVTRMFNTDIYAKRNHLTTLLGNILTDGNDINVEVKPGFGGTENPNINYNVITSGSELLEAIENGGSYMVGNDIYVSAPVASTLATRGATADEGKVTTINLNGKTITVTNKTKAPFATVEAGNTLFLEGGNIVLTEGSTASFIENDGNVVLKAGEINNHDNNNVPVIDGKIVVNDAELNDEKVDNSNIIEDNEAWFADVFANGGTFTLSGDMSFKDIFVVTAAQNPVVINGNGHTITSTAGRAINVDGATADVTIKNLNIVASGERAINVINGSKKVTIENVTAKAANYTVNVAGSAPNATVVINNSDLTGLNTVNIGAENTNVVITNTKITTDDKNDNEGYGAISVNSNGTNSTVTVNGGEIVVHGDSVAAGVSGDYSVVTFNDTTGATNDDVVYYNFEINYGDNAYTFTSLNDALNIAKDNEEVTVVRSFSVSEPLVIEEGQIATINLNGKTISTTLVEGSTTNHIYAFENHGSLTIKDSKGTGKIIARGNFNYGTMTLESGTIDACDGNGGYGVRNYEGANFTMNGGSIVTSLEDDNKVNNGGYDATTLRIDEGATATINGGTINNICDYTFAIENHGEITINGGTFTSIHSTVSTYGDLTIYGGTFTCNGIEGITAHVLWAAAGTTTIEGGTFNGKDNYNGFNVDASEGAIVYIKGGKFLHVHSGSLYGEGTISVTGGEFFDNPSARVAEGYKAIQNEDGSWSVIDSTVAKIGETKYATLNDAVAAVKDGDTITLVANEVFTENNYYDNGGWKDGLGYAGDKSFTIDLGGKTISQNGALNDYLLWFKNVGSKANTITIKNGTLDAGTSAYCALCTASSHDNQLTINLENVNLINNKSNGSTIKVRAGSVVNVNAGSKITGKDSYLGIENWNATVNVYDGAEIYMNGTSSYNGCLIGVGGNGTINVYGGYGKGVKGGFIAMTSGGTINVSGGEWIANTDGTIGDNSNLYVLTAQNNKYESGYAGASIINVTGGTFRGGMDAWILNDVTVEKAELNISGGNFNANPASYVVEGYEAIDNENGTWVVR